MLSDVIGGALIGAVIGGLFGGIVWLFKRRGQAGGAAVAVTPAQSVGTGRRVLMAIVWAIIFYLGALIVGSGMAGGLAGARAGSATGGAAGRIAGAEFGRRFGGIILLCAIALSALGTASGFLPGTKGRPSAPLQEQTPPDGVWPPPPRSSAAPDDKNR